MAFDKPTRNRLAKFVADARSVITDEFTEQFQSLYGISATGQITPLGNLRHLDDAGLAIAGRLRERIDYLVKTHPDEELGEEMAVKRLAREQAFTILNRFAAVRMAEKRGLIEESVGQGYQSKGFTTFEYVAGSGIGDIYERYRRFLFCLFDELTVDLGVLFDRASPSSLLFPRETALLALLELFQADELEPLWAEDETIGWIYQYYNDPEERKKMRKESAAPRNSRELAVRNQFFTPRYVVEFLTDNTLGRIWYEMTKGHTRLTEQCRYLVRRPTEIFLAEGEAVPETPDQEGLSQEELLRQPVHIPPRPLKDPREIRLLDPACGSMHFGLYAFDLFETIYEEAWDMVERMKDEGRSMKELESAYPEFSSFILHTSSFSSKEEFLREVPRLIIEHNIHGIDIDPRAVQIAGLSLWLRAQKSWQARGVAPADRPRVRRSNIVCAEPMPGSPEMLEEFVATLKPDLLGELVKTVFDKMQLAGEAGSLLKIEEEIRTAIDTARKEWLKQQDDLLTRKDGGQEEFFDTAEQQVIDALRAYAEQADADSYQRRLFADDAARGFAFIDLCRKRYDAVVMNPPFGDPSGPGKEIIKKAYGSAGKEMYAAFVNRAVDMLYALGQVGAITSRSGLFILTFKNWREEAFFENKRLRLLLDLGSNVLDAAMVETACYVLQKEKPTGEFTAIRRIAETEKSKDLDLICSNCSSGNQSSDLFLADLEKIKMLPGHPIAYWVSPGVLALFKSQEGLSESGTRFQCGMFTTDDERFVRLSWECPANGVLFPYGWSRFAKGGDNIPFFCPTEVLVKSIHDFKENAELIVSKYEYLNGDANWILHRENDYGAPALSFTLRTSSPLAVRALPRQSYFANKGPAVFDDDPWFLLGLLNSQTTRDMIDLFMGRAEGGARQYDISVLGNIPAPTAERQLKSKIGSLAQSATTSAMECWKSEEPSSVFLQPFPFMGDASSIQALLQSTSAAFDDACTEIENCLKEIDQRVAVGFFGTENNGCLTLETDGKTNLSFKGSIGFDFSPTGAASAILSHLFGTAFGRWDIRYATGERQPPELPDPFDPLPVCPPGMLQNAEGLPAEPKDVPADYPLPISWPGILVDDENHPEDIVARVREAIEVIWKDRAEAIEEEACEILGVNSLRDYFRRPAAFFADHLKRYSKSRRQAPIYWPLSTKSGSYTLWLYYHRLDDRTLHICLADFLDPKIKKTQKELDDLNASGQSGSRVGELRDFLDELHDLRDEIERVIKLPWKPNLNDGVLITASPLHKLFRLPKWQAGLKACWDKLAKGDYDWAHLAYTIWPQRVEKACERDRSIAIAHDREDLCKVEPPKPKKKRAAKKAAKKKAKADEPELLEEE